MTDARPDGSRGFACACCRCTACCPCCACCATATACCSTCLEPLPTLSAGPPAGGDPRGPTATAGLAALGVNPP